MTWRVNSLGGTADNWVHLQRTIVRQEWRKEAMQTEAVEQKDGAGRQEEHGQGQMPSRMKKDRRPQC
ncbi:hypothetical protein CYMTET_17630 [Cymbomonas tetramitiformis]|uniref:Uncharacterized protein n=1 Tax=Cymbomonas tetramitiformis TaxID=36881 RepID=A0AAE0GA71_9CHLO|nr:hypothetical protein CYMTET_17630 [Cymbomonas tetramitiformis]